MRGKSLVQLALVAIYYTLAGSSLLAQNLPEKQVPPRLVNDFAGMLSVQEIGRLEQKLVLFNDSTSTQIAIVTVKDLEGYDKADYAQRLGEKWGVGQKGLNNGILILVKPKTPESKGEVQIVSGYGVEGAVPDLICADIVDNEILPAFRNGDYYGGLNAATSTIISLVRGEFSASDYGRSAKKSSGKNVPFGLVIFIVFIIIAMVSGKSGGSNSKNISTGGLPLWLLLGAMSSGRGSSGSWGGFSGGGSSGGGFGGFGGGSFGGGGAGGSW